MDTGFDIALHTALAGLGATLAVDAWALLRRRLFGLPPPNYALLGRWLAHMRHGRFRHAAIAKATPVRGEHALGWASHYGIGIAFASLLPLGWGTSWLQQPQLMPALIVGIATVLAPFLLMQPGMGLGLAARYTPRPNRTRLHSLATHAVFGLGLYAAALAASSLIHA